MTRSKQTFAFTWQGLDIEVRYLPSWSESFERSYGRHLAHLEVMQPERRPPPFTETGYRSHFTPADEIEGAGGPVAYVEQRLAWAAQDPAWKKAEAARRQGSLF